VTIAVTATNRVLNTQDLFPEGATKLPNLNKVCHLPQGFVNLCGQSLVNRSVILAHQPTRQCMGESKGVFADKRETSPPPAA
jgi:hypothetical protein